MVALITDTGQQVEGARYSAYGIPFGSYAGDADNDGDVDTTDTTQIQTWIDAPAYDVRGDLDLDGDVDSTDKTTATNNIGNNLAWMDLGEINVDNRRGYAGYEHDLVIQRKYSAYHVRNRVLNSTFGQWMQRREAGSNRYAYLLHDDATAMSSLPHISIAFSFQVCGIECHNCQNYTADCPPPGCRERDVPCPTSTLDLSLELGLELPIKFTGGVGGSLTLGGNKQTPCAASIPCVRITCKPITQGFSTTPDGEVIVPAYRAYLPYAYVCDIGAYIVRPVPLDCSSSEIDECRDGVKTPADFLDLAPQLPPHNGPKILEWDPATGRYRHRF